MGKKVLSIILAVLMLMSAFSLSVFADTVMNDGVFDYVIANGGAKIIDCHSESSVLNIPKQLGDFSVKEIAENALNNEKINTVFIPSCCETIAENASEHTLIVYGFKNTSAEKYASKKAYSFVSLGAKDSYNSYVGKSITFNTLSGNATLQALDSILGVTGKTVKSLAKGNGELLVTLENGIQYVLTVKVNEAPQKIINLPSKINLYTGDVYTKLNPQIEGGEYDNEFSYSISNTAIASIDKTGKITAKKPGSVKVKVAYSNGIFAEIPLNVGNKPLNFSLNKHDLLLGVGEPAALTYTLGANQIFKKLTFSSNNTGVVTVDAKGKITAKAVGTVRITATLDNGKKDTCVITVGKAPTSIKLAKASIVIGVGESVKYKASVNRGAVCSSYLWRSGNSNIFTVDESGNIIGKKPGSAKLYAYTYNYKSKKPYIRAAATVTVKKAPGSVSFNKTNLVLGIGESYDLNASLPSGTASYKMSVAMENNKIAVNGAKMVVTAKALGTTYFTIKTFNGKIGKCKITVKPAPKKIACKPTTVKLAINQSYRLSPYVNKGAACTGYVYRTSNKKVCTVSSKGVVKVKDYGSCYIYIDTYNSTAAHPISCKVKFNVGYITNKIATYTTYFDRYYYGKSTNLKLACKYINGKTDGYILQPGQVFAFNKAVGPRTSARGFVDAKVVQGDGYVDGIGGGICQAASTIFNATLIGNLSILERHYHNLKSSYVPVGRDATVFWGSQDFKFKNNYNTPIRIKMNYSASGSINCSIYSLKKVSLPKIGLNVSKVKGGYKLTRTASGKVNYTTYSYYAN